MQLEAQFRIFAVAGEEGNFRSSPSSPIVLTYVLLYLSGYDHNSVVRVRTRLNPMVRRDIFSFYFVLFLRTGIRTVLTPLVIHHWPEKSADHGSRRLLPIASPMGCRHPNPAYRRHPHTMGEHTNAQFGRPTCLGQEIV